MTRRQTLTLAGVAAVAFAWAAPPAPAAQWRVPRDFRTIQAAVDSPRVGDGDVILVGAGRHSGAVVTKAVEIRGNGKAVIVDGPRRWPAVPEWEAGFYFPGKGQGSGASLVHLRFAHVDLPVFSAGADDVTVARCTLESPLQGITNWGGDGWGNGWDVTGNTIQGLRSACAGGIGILVGDYAGAGPPATSWPTTSSGAGCARPRTTAAVTTAPGSSCTPTSATAGRAPAPSSRTACPRTASTSRAPTPKSWARSPWS